MLPVEVEEALAELVALGMVNSDSFAGLRVLLMPSGRRGKSTSYSACAASAAWRCSEWRTRGAGHWCGGPRRARGAR